MINRVAVVKLNGGERGDSRHNISQTACVFAARSWTHQTGMPALDYNMYMLCRKYSLHGREKHERDFASSRKRQPGVLPGQDEERRRNHLIESCERTLQTEVGVAGMET